MRQMAESLRAEVADRAARFRALRGAQVAASRGPGKWTRREILGHLIDSAANNHQRFVRAQFADPFEAAGYDQDAWVATQGYGERSWPELVALWVALNDHVAHVIERIPPERLQTVCRIGGDEPVSLEWLIRDYLRHLNHHADQILSP